MRSLRLRNGQSRREPLKLFSVSMMLHGPTLLMQTALGSPPFIDIRPQRFLSHHQYTAILVGDIRSDDNDGFMQPKI